MKATLERLLNELPIIAVGAWAVLRVVGIDLDDETTTNIVTAVESGVSLVIALLVRHSIEGPVSAYRTWTASKLPEDR